MTDVSLRRALASFPLDVFAQKVGARKESLSPHSHEWLFTCPRCQSSRLRFNTEKRMGWCWRCKYRFSTFTLVRDVLGFSEAECVDWLLSNYIGGDSNAQALSSELTGIHPVKPTLRVLPTMPWPDGAELLTDPSCLPHAKAWAYLETRGIDPAMVREYKLAYGRAGRVKNRIVFPVRMDGAMVYWQARAIWDPPLHLSREEKKRWVEETGYVKTINPVVVDESQTQAHEVIFNFDRASYEPHVVICEGPIDAVKVGPHAVALLGKSASAAKLERLRRMRTQLYTIYLDYGADEWEAANRIAAELTQYGQVRLAFPPAGTDPGELTQAQNAYIVGKAGLWKPAL